MTKLPDPAIRQERFHYNSYGEITAQLPDLIGYTEAQMLQSRRDALEEAASICFKTEDSDDEYVSTRHTIASAIRKLKGET